MPNMLDHNYSCCDVSDGYPGYPVLADDILLYNGFRYVLKWVNIVDWKWDDDIEYKWAPFGEEADDAPEIEFDRSVLIPVRFINEDGNILWRVNDEE